MPAQQNWVVVQECDYMSLGASCLEACSAGRQANFRYLLKKVRRRSVMVREKVESECRERTFLFRLSRVRFVPLVSSGTSWGKC